MKKFTGLFIVSLLVLSCGKDDKRTSKYSALDSSQRSQFSQFLTSTENTVQAPLDLKKQKGGMGAIDSASSNISRRQMVERLEKGSCTVKSNFEGTGLNGQMPSMGKSAGDYYLNVSGATCPSTMDTRFKYSFTQTSITASFSAKYTVQDAEYKKLNDVTGFDLSGDFSASGNQDSFEGKGAVNGTIESTLHGQVKLEMSAEMKGDKNKMDTYIVVTITFPTYTAEIKMIGEGDPNDPKFETYLNGEKLDSKQSKQVRRLMGIL